MNGSEDINLSAPEREPQRVPEELAILPLLGTVVYPLTVVPLALSQPASVQLVDEALRGDGVIGLVALREDTTRPALVEPEHCFSIGTAAIVHRLLRLPDNTLRIAAEGIGRIAIEQVLATTPSMRARVRLLTEHGSPEGAVVERLVGQVQAQAVDLAQHLPGLSDELQADMLTERAPERLVYLLASSMLPHSSVTERQELLALDDLTARLERLRALLAREQEALRRAGAVARRPIIGGTESLERRAELLGLPLAQELLERGRQRGLVEGKAAAAAAILRARFGAARGLDELLSRLATLEDSALLDRLVVLAATAAQFEEVAAAALASPT